VVVPQRVGQSLTQWVHNHHDRSRIERFVVTACARQAVRTPVASRRVSSSFHAMEGRLESTSTEEEYDVEPDSEDEHCRGAKSLYQVSTSDTDTL